MWRGCVVGDDIEQSVGLVRRENGLVLNGSPKHADELTQFADLFFAHALIDGIAIDEVFF